MPPRVITVDGGIGAGKTVYINMIVDNLTKKGLKVVLVKEPVDKWQESGILNLFYKNPERWAYHFQTKAFHDRVVENVNMYAEHGETADLYILERSPFTDNLFMEVLYDDKLVTDLEYRDYKQWWSLWYKVMPYTPDIFIYLRPDVDVQMERINNRNRPEETGTDAAGTGGVTREYQEKLVGKHDEFFANGVIDIGMGTSRLVPCIKLETNENFKDDHEVQKRFVAEFEGLLAGLSS